MLSFQHYSRSSSFSWIYQKHTFDVKLPSNLQFAEHLVLSEVSSERAKTMSKFVFILSSASQLLFVCYTLTTSDLPHHIWQSNNPPLPSPMSSLPNFSLIQTAGRSLIFNSILFMIDICWLMIFFFCFLCQMNSFFLFFHIFSFFSIDYPLRIIETYCWFSHLFFIAVHDWFILLIINNVWFPLFLHHLFSTSYHINVSWLSSLYLNVFGWIHVCFDSLEAIYMFAPLTTHTLFTFPPFNPFSSSPLSLLPLL